MIEPRLIVLVSGWSSGCTCESITNTRNREKNWYIAKRSRGESNKAAAGIQSPLSGAHSSVAPMMLSLPSLSKRRERTAWSRSYNGRARKKRASITWNEDEEAAPSGLNLPASSTS